MRMIPYYILINFIYLLVGIIVLAVVVPIGLLVFLCCLVGSAWDSWRIERKYKRMINQINFNIQEDVRKISKQKRYIQ
jgi:hypothetical protein